MLYIAGYNIYIFAITGGNSERDLINPRWFRCCCLIDSSLPILNLSIYINISYNL